MFSINFCPVPDFIRELPVTYSGPTIISIGISASAASGLPGLLVAGSEYFVLACVVERAYYVWRRARGCNAYESVVFRNIVLLQLFPAFVVVVFGIFDRIAQGEVAAGYKTDYE